MKRSRIILWTLFGATLALGGVRLTEAVGERTAHYSFYDPLIDVYTLVNRSFFKDPPLEAMREGAIRGMIEALDDPYTEFIPTQDVGDFDKYVRGQFVGIGASVVARDGFLGIVSPLDDSPAYRAGIEADDLVVAVDGESVFGQSVDQIIAKLSGRPGTMVRVTLERTGGESDRPSGAQPPSVPGPVGDAPGPAPDRIRFDLAIVRERIVTSTVKGIHRDGERWIYMIDPERRFAYVRVNQFTEGTVPELEAVVRDLVGQGLNGLILDLRFNGGGTLNGAIGMSDLFLSDGLIVSQRGRSGREQRTYAQPEGTLPDFPLVVLVNESSASASEIVAGALSDNGRATIVGTRTFGKGLVQSVYRLPSGVGQLKITEQYYYLPSGRCIQREDDATEWGVDPTEGFYVSMTDGENRDMLRRRRAEEIIRVADPDKCCWDDPDWIEQELKDPQFSAALQALRLRAEHGEWVPTGTPLPVGGLERAELRREEKRREVILRELERVQRRIDALENAAAAGSRDEFSLIPEDAPISGGNLIFTDADGKEVARLRITSPTLGRWLIDAPLERLDERPEP